MDCFWFPFYRDFIFKGFFSTALELNEVFNSSKKQCLFLYLLFFLLSSQEIVLQCFASLFSGSFWFWLRLGFRGLCSFFFLFLFSGKRFCFIMVFCFFLVPAGVPGFCSIIISRFVLVTGLVCVLSSCIVLFPGKARPMNFSYT